MLKPSVMSIRPIRITTDCEAAINYIAQTRQGLHFIDIAWKPYLTLRLAKSDVSDLYVYDKDRFDSKRDPARGITDQNFWRSIYRADPDYILCTVKTLQPVPYIDGLISGALTGHVVVSFLPSTTRFQDIKALKKDVDVWLWKDAVAQIGLSLGKSPRKSSVLPSTQAIDTTLLDLL